MKNKYTYHKNFKYKGQSINILVWNKGFKWKS